MTSRRTSASSRPISSTQLRSGKSLADIATAQGKTVDGLKTAITDATTKQLDAAVTAGKLTKDQETKLLAGLASRLDDLVNGVHGPGGFGRFGRGGPGFGFGFGFGGPGLTSGIADVATYLDLKPADLATQLQSGKSLAEIAKAQGKTVDGLKTAITDAMTKQFDAAVTAGKLTKDQETKLLADLGSRLDDLVNGVHGPGGFGRFGHGHGGWKGDDDGNGSVPQDGSPPPAAPADLAPAPPRPEDCSGLLRRAAAAESDDREVAEARFEAGRLAHGSAHAVELLRRHRALHAAALAHEVLAFAAGTHVAPGAVTQVDVLHEAEALERLEVAIDGGEVGGRELPEALGDLLGAERHVGGIQRLQHHAPRHREAQSTRAQGRHGLVHSAGFDARTRVGGGHLTARVVDRAGDGLLDRHMYDRAG